jgi:hypothetical protein
LRVPLELEEIALAKGLLTGDALAFEGGAAPLLLRALERPVAQAIVAERAPIYVTILFGMLLRRREHELEPLHEDLERFLAPALAALETDRDDQAFARDVDALVAWGCLERHAEPLKIRGYKDLRRERFRYRLSEDAVALLGWLEARLSARLEGRSDDGRDLLVDVLGQLRELSRIVTLSHKGEREEDAPRRTMYLLGLIDERVNAISEELLGFRASMLAFSARPYDLEALRAILGWLERYVAVYLAGLRRLGGEIHARIDDLSAPRFRNVLVEHQTLLLRERAQAPAAFRSGGAVRNATDLLNALRIFFADNGQLAELCARIDDSARAVVRKMHRHLRELERRNARLEDVRERIAEVARLRAGDDADPRLAAFANALVASAHARFGSRSDHTGARVTPPLPRKHATPAIDRSNRPPLRPKQAPAESVRELRARRLADLREWLDTRLLQGKDEVRLADVRVEGPSLPRRWLDVSRARHLDRGRDLHRLDVSIEKASGEVRLGDEREGICVPDCVVRVSR